MSNSFLREGTPDPPFYSLIARYQYNLTIHPQGARMPRSIILSLAFIAAPSLVAQTIHTTADMQQREAKLLATAKAAPTGLGTDIMDDYGNDRTLLVVGVPSGDPDRHQFWADQMVVKKGTITLVTGGTLQ